MHSIQIEITIRAELHEPSPYEHFPALQVEAFAVPEDGHARGKTLLAHRCEDIRALPSSDNREETLAAARDYLSANWKPLVQALIAKFGE